MVVQLPNHLRSNRKRLALLHEDVAFLLGAETGESVCRHERFTREPSLAIALGYEAIYQRPIRELFPGLYQKMEGNVAALVKTLSDRTKMVAKNRQTDRKRQVLATIVERIANQPSKNS